MYKTTLKIEGMMCGMCEAHVADVIRKTLPGAKKVSVSRAKGQATFICEDLPPNDELIHSIAATGYTCLSVDSETYVKKGLFRR
jgi:copper chaperone CopZ